VACTYFPSVFLAIAFLHIFEVHLLQTNMCHYFCHCTCVIWILDFIFVAFGVRIATDGWLDGPGLIPGSEIYRVFRAQSDWTCMLLLELPMKELCHLPRKMSLQAYQTSQYVVPHSGIFLGKWRSTFAGSSDGKMNVQSACTLNTLYFSSPQCPDRL
jgi:hypothetical protein